VQIGGDVFDATPFLQQFSNLLVFHVLKRNVFINRFVVRRSANDHHKQTHSERPDIRLIRHKLLLFTVHFGCFIMRFTDIFGADKIWIPLQIEEFR